MGYIYKIVNQINDKVYIGQTKKSIEERFKVHLKYAERKVNRYLYNAMNAYGYENFSVEEIEQCDNRDLDEREKYWIRFYGSNEKSKGYNMTIGGGGGDTWTNNQHKAETSRKISEKNKGKKRSPETIARISKGRKGKYSVDIDYDKLYAAIQSGEDLDTICTDFGISLRTLILRCRTYFGCEIKDIRISENYSRKKPVYSEKTLSELSRIRSENFKGHNNPNYKDVDKDYLYKLLKSNMSLDEISRKLNISKPTITAKTKSYFGMTVREVRKL